MFKIVIRSFKQNQKIDYFKESNKLSLTTKI